jgi:hypothetical protein
MDNEFLQFNIFKLRTYLRVRSLYHVTVDSDYKSSVSFIHWIIKIFDFYNKLCSHYLTGQFWMSWRTRPGI